MATRVRDLPITEEGLWLEAPLLREARLGRHVWVIVREGEIRILPAEEDWGKVLDDLAGCLGEEPVQNYDFNLKIGGLYETR
ncbi:MAG: hypothetical protein J7575_00215 [Chloroflexi bacterium]|jgi:hypothetical protein|nr:hypothetical protein [Chloroflexota bacterium]